MRAKFNSFRNLTYDIRKGMELIPSIQTYDWGKCGNTSKVAMLFKNVKPDFVIEANKPYAELWMGTHVNGPSFVKHAQKSLLEIVSEQPDYLGNAVRSKYGNDLPYLLKVLSIQKSLSIQVHPSKDHAERLHAQRSDLYKDPNHKPELAIALTPFETLCGFRPLTEIAAFFQMIPELVELMEGELCDAFIRDKNEKRLKECFYALMTCTDEKIKSAFDNIFKRFSTLGAEDCDKQLANLVQRLYKQFPNDVGGFVVYFLNYLRLKPLEAIYLGANLPHAYLSGDCVECMACSDNVVRAGLTPKFKDVDTLCSMLDYRGEPASTKIFKPIDENDYTVVFRPPVPDFAVAKIQVRNEMQELSLISRNSGSILLIITGTATSDDIKLIPGVSIFIPAERQVKLQRVSKDFLAFQAMANLE